MRRQNCLRYSSFLFVGFLIWKMGIWSKQENTEFIETKSREKIILADPKNYPLGKNKIDFTYDDPKSYQGPIVQSWPPSKDRNLSLYIKPYENNILTDLSCMDLTDTKILILIQTSPLGSNRRDADRKTWRQLTKDYPQVKIIYIMGVESQFEKKIIDQSEFENELKKYCDIVQFDYHDHYVNITLDTYSAIKFALSWNWNSQPPEFVAISDDDTYVNIQALFDMLYKRLVIPEHSKEMIGHLFPNAPVIKITEDQRNNKYINHLTCSVPEYLFNRENYCPFLSGGFYVMRFETLKCLYSSGLTIPFLNINDVHIGYAAEMCGYPRINGANYIYPTQLQIKRLKPNVVAIHKSSSELKHIYHYILAKQNSVFNQIKPNRYLVNNGTLYWCDENTKCKSSLSLLEINVE